MAESLREEHRSLTQEFTRVGRAVIGAAVPPNQELARYTKAQTELATAVAKTTRGLAPTAGSEGEGAVSDRPVPIVRAWVSIDTLGPETEITYYFNEDGTSGYEVDPPGICVDTGRWR